MYLHHIMSSMDIKNQNRSVLWAYKNKLLGFTRYAGTLGFEEVVAVQSLFLRSPNFGFVFDFNPSDGLASSDQITIDFPFFNG